jgi:hypothetical protein
MKKYHHLKEFVEFEDGGGIAFGANDKEEAYEMYKKYSKEEHGFEDDEIDRIEDMEYRKIRISYGKGDDGEDMFYCSEEDPVCKECGRKLIFDEIVMAYIVFN